MKQNEKGFSAVEAILVLVIIGLISGAGWYVWQSKNSTQNKSKHNSSQQNSSSDKGPRSQQLATYKRTTSVPSDWKIYTNDKYKFSISYPPNWKIDAHEGGKLAESSPVANKEFFSLGFRPYSTGPMEIQYSLEVSHETIEQAVNWDKAYTIDSQSAGSAVKNTITDEEYFTYDGHKAVRIDITSEDGSLPDSYASHIYISANEVLYKFNSGFHDTNAMKDPAVLAVFESLKIK